MPRCVKRRQEPPSPFLSLPGEIRRHIYTLLLTQPKPIFPNGLAIFNRIEMHENGKRPLSEPETVLALTRTCKQLYEEVTEVYYGTNHFEFRNVYELYLFLYLIGEQRRTLIRHVEFWYEGACSWEAFALLGECRNLKK